MFASNVEGRINIVSETDFVGYAACWLYNILSPQCMYDSTINGFAYHSSESVYSELMVYSTCMFWGIGFRLRCNVFSSNHKLVNAGKPLPTRIALMSVRSEKYTLIIF